MTGWQITFIIIGGLILFCGYVLPTMRLLWAWVHIWEERAEVALESTKRRSDRRDSYR